MLYNQGDAVRVVSKTSRYWGTLATFVSYNRVDSDKCWIKTIDGRVINLYVDSVKKSTDEILSWDEII